MGVTKTILKEGHGPVAKVGDTVTIQYTGWLKDPSKPNGRGEQYVFHYRSSCRMRTSPIDMAHQLIIFLDRFDSSIGRGAFVVDIGVGKVIKGIPSVCTVPE